MMPGLLSSNTIDPTAFIVSNCAFQDCYGIIVRPMRIIPCRPVLVNLACLLSCCHLLMHHNACLPICLIKYCFHSVVVITRPSQHDCTPIIARTRSWVRAPVKAIVLLSFAISPCFFGSIMIEGGNSASRAYWRFWCASHSFCTQAPLLS
jgi:hypothetical protein